MTLPDFIIIGAAKAATTWIQVQLQANPAIFMPDPEPHFFSREYDRGEAHYRRWFADASGSARRIGEKSADYLSDAAVPARLAALIPDAKLVVQLRNPVDRAYSDYKMFFRRGSVGGNPDDYLRDPDNSHPRFLRDGLYGEHLQRWLEHFPKENILVFRYEDVGFAPREVIERVSQHIGVPMVYDDDLANRRANNSRELLLPLPLRKLLAPLKDSVAPLRGKTWFEGVRQALARQVKYPELGLSLRRRMADFYADDIARTERLTGLDLSEWRSEVAETA